MGHQYNPEMVELLLRLADQPPEKTFSSIDEMMAWLNDENPPTAIYQKLNLRPLD